MVGCWIPTLWLGMILLGGCLSRLKPRTQGLLIESRQAYFGGK